eukprot:scaffold42727_cov55-Phaeocystis_antarctica.AAC.2
MGGSTVAALWMRVRKCFDYTHGPCTDSCHTNCDMTEPVNTSVGPYSTGLTLEVKAPRAARPMRAAHAPSHDGEAERPHLVEPQRLRADHTAAG